MYCKKCGKEIPDNSNYCQYCGNIQTSDNPRKKIVVQFPIIEFKTKMTRKDKILFVLFLIWSLYWIFLLIGGELEDVEIILLVWIAPVFLYNIPRIIRWILKQLEFHLCNVVFLNTYLMPVSLLSHHLSFSYLLPYSVLHCHYNRISKSHF